MNTIHVYFSICGNHDFCASQNIISCKLRNIKPIFKDSLPNKVIYIAKSKVIDIIYFYFENFENLREKVLLKLRFPCPILSE